MAGGRQYLGQQPRQGLCGQQRKEQPQGVLEGVVLELEVFLILVNEPSVVDAALATAGYHTEALPVAPAGTAGAWRIAVLGMPPAGVGTVGSAFHAAAAAAAAVVVAALLGQAPAAHNIHNDHHT